MGFLVVVVVAAPPAPAPPPLPAPGTLEPAPGTAGTAAFNTDVEAVVPVAAAFSNMTLGTSAIERYVHLEVMIGLNSTLMLVFSQHFQLPLIVLLELLLPQWCSWLCCLLVKLRRELCWSLCCL